MPLIVTLAGIEPGAPLAAASALADELDARRVPLTLLVGPRPHPEVVAWTVARRRAGDAVLLHGTAQPGTARRDERRLPAHEAGLRLAGALRSRDVLGLPIDGFAAPGWAASTGTRQALGAATLAEVSVLVDADGVHRLAADGSALGSCRGPVIAPDAPAARGSWPARAARLRPARRSERAGDRLVHVTGTASGDVRGLLAAVDDALVAGAVPAVPAALVPAGPTARRRSVGHPELWSITA